MRRQLCQASGSPSLRKGSTQQIGPQRQGRVSGKPQEAPHVEQCLEAEHLPPCRFLHSLPLQLLSTVCRAQGQPQFSPMGLSNLWTIFAQRTGWFILCKIFSVIQEPIFVKLGDFIYKWSWKYGWSGSTETASDYGNGVDSSYWASLAQAVKVLFLQTTSAILPCLCAHLCHLPHKHLSLWPRCGAMLLQWPEKNGLLHFPSDAFKKIP